MGDKLTTRMIRKPGCGATGSHAWLIIVKAPNDSGLKPGITFRVGPTTTIGRLADSTIPLTDDSVSRDHAMFEHRADGWYLTDQGSTNGTFLSCRKIEGGVKLGAYESLTFGEVEAAFWFGELNSDQLSDLLKKRGVQVQHAKAAFQTLDD